MGIYFMFGGPVYFFCGAKFQIVISRLLINIFDSKFILQNTYITFGGLVLQQAKGIPMGSNCSFLQNKKAICRV